MRREDLKHGLRTLRRRPAFAAAVISLLALGIGTLVTVASLVEAVLLNPLPYPSPGRLVAIAETEQSRDGSGAYPLPLKPAWFSEWRQARSVASMAAVYEMESTLVGGEAPERILGAEVTSELFPILGGDAALGRTLVAADEHPAATPVAVLSDGLWRRRFGAEPEILGKTLQLDRVAVTVVGVMPPGFNLASPYPRKTEIWTPLDLTSKMQDLHSLTVVGRLADGVTLEQARSEMETIAAAVAAASAQGPSAHGARVSSFHTYVVGRSRAQVLVLFAAAAFVLLIVCANAGGLLMARTAARKTELAVRASLGAGRARLAGQLLAENLPLGVLGGIAGVGAAAWGLQVLRAMIPEDVPRAQQMSLDGSVLAFAAGVTLLAVALLATAPALAASRVHLAARLRQSRAAGLGRGQRLLIAVQLALTLVLAHGAALMLASYARLQATEQGFDPRTLTAGMALAGPRYEEPEQVAAMLRELLPRVESLPGVESAAATGALPLYTAPTDRMVIEGRENDWPGSDGPRLGRFLVTPGYFRTLGMSLVAGRLLSPEDLSSNRPVAVVSRRTAELAWQGADPIGRRLALEPGSDWITVVGVVTDVRHFGPEARATAAVYMPYSSAAAFWEGWTTEDEIVSLVLRTEISAEGLLGPLREAIRSVDPAQPIADVLTLGEMLHSVGARRRLNTLLITTFAVLGVVLIVIGIYALTSTYVTQRTRDIGVRMALGAGTPGVVRLVLGQGAWLLLCGVGAGLVAVFALTRLLEGLLYAVSPTEPAVLAAGIAFVAAVALLGSLVPALRATRIDPATALRDEE